MKNEMAEVDLIPQISTIIINYGSEQSESLYLHWENQDVADVELLVTSVENLLETIQSAKGEYVHICDDYTFPLNTNVYKTILKKMIESGADIGCFCWDSSPLEEENGHQHKSADYICGNGNHYTLLREVFKNDSGNNSCKSYGGRLFNKIFKRELFAHMSSFCGTYTQGLYDLWECGILVQVASLCHKVVFESRVLVGHETVSTRQNIKDIHLSTLFQSVFELLKDCEKIDARLLEHAAQTCLEYELDLYAKMNARKWYDSATLLYEHITSFYEPILPNKNILDLSVGEYVSLYKSQQEQSILREKNINMNDRIEKINRDKEWLQKQNSKLTRDKELLQEKNTKAMHDIEWLQNKKKSLEENREWLQKQKKSLEEDREWLQSKKKSLEEDREWLQKQNQKLKEDRTALQQQNKMLKEDREWLQKKKQGLEEKRTELQKQKSELEQQLNEKNILLNKRLVRVSLKIHSFFERIKKKIRPGSVK